MIVITTLNARRNYFLRGFPKKNLSIQMDLLSLVLLSIFDNRLFVHRDLYLSVLIYHFVSKDLLRIKLVASNLS